MLTIIIFQYKKMHGLWFLGKVISQNPFDIHRIWLSMGGKLDDKIV